MKIKQKSASFVALLLAALLAAAGCGQAAPGGAGGDGDPQHGGTLVVGFDSLDESYDPAVFTSWAGINTINNVFDTLVQTTDGETFEPGLAVSWTVSDDGLVYTFQLREGVSFHDGTALNADAVQFSIERQTNPDHPYHFPGMTQADLAFGSLDRVEVTGEFEVQLILSEPNAAQLANLAIFSTGIVSPQAVMEMGEDFATSPVGSGPFKFENLDRGQQVVLVANEDYWDGRPYLDRVIIRSIPEDSSRVAALRTGEIDLTTYIDAKDMPSLEGDDSITTMRAAANSTGYMGMNARHEALSHKQVRQALSHAIDRENIIDLIFDGSAVPVAGWLPPMLFAYDESLIDYYPYDPERARELLAEAGFADGFDVTFDVHASAHWPRLAELIQEDFRQIGVRAEIIQRDTSATFALVNAGEHGIFFADWTGANLDPDYFMITPFHSESPRADGRLYYANPEYDRLVIDAQRSTDIDERRELYLEAQRLVMEDAPMAFLYYNEFRAGMQDNVHGFNLNPIRYLFFKNVWLDD